MLWFGVLAPSSQAAISAGASLPLASSPAAPGAADTESCCHPLSLKKKSKAVSSAIVFPSLPSLHDRLGESFCWGDVN